MHNDIATTTAPQLAPTPGQPLYYVGIDNFMRTAAVVSCAVSAVNSGASVLHLSLHGADAYSFYKKAVKRVYGRGLVHGTCRLPYDLLAWGDNTPEGHDLIATRTLEALGFAAEGGYAVADDFQLFKAILTDALGRLSEDGKPLNKATLTEFVGMLAESWAVMPSQDAEITLFKLLRALPAAHPFWDEAYDFSHVDSPRSVQTLSIGNKNAHQMLCELHRFLKARASREDVRHPLVLVLEDVCPFPENYPNLLALATAANTSIVFVGNTGNRLPSSLREQLSAGGTSVRFAPPFYQGAAALGAELGVAAETEKAIAQAAGNAVIDFSKQGVRLLPH